jgi:hypothetical protein
MPWTRAFSAESRWREAASSRRRCSISPPDGHPFSFLEVTTIARLWLRVAVRRRGESFVGLLVFAGFTAMFGRYGNQSAAHVNSPFLTGLFLTGMLAVMFVPMFVESGTALNSDRLAIAPISRRKLIAIRLLWANPLRTLMQIVVLVVVGTGLLGNSSGWVFVFELWQLIACALAAHLAVQWIEHIGSKAAPTVVMLFSFVLAYLAAVLLFTYPEIYRAIPWERWPSRDSAVFLGTDAGLLDEALVTGMAVTLGVLGTNLTRRRMRRRGAMRIGRFTGAIRKAIGAVWNVFPGDRLHVPSIFAKEFAQLGRSSFGRSFSLLMFAAALFLLVADVPMLLPVAAFPWFAYLHNQEGIDAARDGPVRHILAGTTHRRRFIPRHIAVAVVSLGCILLAMATTRGFFHARIELLPLATATLATLATIALATVSGDIASIRSPKPIARKAGSPGFVSSMALLYLLGSGLLVLGAFSVALGFVRFWLRLEPGIHMLALAYFTYSCLAAGIYAFGCIVVGPKYAA